MTGVLAKVNKGEQKKKPFLCTIKKRNLIIAAYRKNNGNITDIIKATGIGRTRFYQILDQFPEVREGT